MNLKSIGKLAMIGLLVAAMTAAMAQGGGGGRGQGRGMGGRFGQGPAQLITRADVQRDLGISDDVKSKLASLSEKLNEDRRAMMQDLMGGGGPPDQAEMQKAMEKFNAKAKEEIAKVLNADQMKRLDEIGIQLQGNRAILLPAVQKALGLSDDVIAKAKDLAAKQQEANRAIFEKVGNGEMTREESQAAQQKNTTALGDELGKLLSADQAAKLKEMGGKPFKADPPRGGGGG